MLEVFYLASAQYFGEYRTVFQLPVTFFTKQLGYRILGHNAVNTRNTVGVVVYLLTTFVIYAAPTFLVHVKRAYLCTFLRESRLI